MKGACDKSAEATGIDQKQKEGGERGENINRRVLIGGKQRLKQKRTQTGGEKERVQKYNGVQRNRICERVT